MKRDIEKNMEYIIINQSSGCVLGEFFFFPFYLGIFDKYKVYIKKKKRIKKKEGRQR